VRASDEVLNGLRILARLIADQLSHTQSCSDEHAGANSMYLDVAELQGPRCPHDEATTRRTGTSNRR